MEYQAIVLAAGNGQRSGLDYNKILYKIDGRPIISLAVQNFIDDNRCNKIVIACKENEINILKNIINDKKIVFVIGGKTRKQSVSNALDMINSDYVLIHDGARPFYSKDLLNRIINGLDKHDAIIPALKITDTIKEVKNNIITNTIDRTYLYSVQTPQGFKTKIIKDGHRLAKDDDKYTDDAMIVEMFTNTKVYIVEGEANNTKYTTKEDFLRS